MRSFNLLSLVAFVGMIAITVYLYFLNETLTAQQSVITTMEITVKKYLGEDGEDGENGKLIGIPDAISEIGVTLELLNQNLYLSSAVEFKFAQKKLEWGAQMIRMQLFDERLRCYENVVYEPSLAASTGNNSDDVMSVLGVLNELINGMPVKGIDEPDYEIYVRDFGRRILMGEKSLAKRLDSVKNQNTYKLARENCGSI